MTKTIEEQIEEARDDLAYARTTYRPEVSTMGAAHDRAVARAASRLATLEAVRDGRMVEAWTLVSVCDDASWTAFHGGSGLAPESNYVKARVGHITSDGDRLTILRGYAHVPSTQVHEVEADSEVPS